MPYIKYGNTDIPYSLYKQDRKDLQIIVDLANGVIIYAPEKTSDKKIHDVPSTKARKSRQLETQHKRWGHVHQKGLFT